MGIPIPKISPTDCYMEEAKQLINLSDRIYTQIRELEEELQHRGMGMADDLDSLDGDNDEPQSNEDAGTARYMQYQIYLLRIDHRRVMEQVETILQQFHQSKTARRRWRVAESSDDDSDDNGMDPFSEQPTTVAQLLPFAKVSGVLPGSPASEAGLQQNDLVLQFGVITRENRHQQHALAAIAQENLDRPLGIKILRNHYQRRTLYPTPRNGWGGLGALGCRILPL